MCCSDNTHEMGAVVCYAYTSIFYSPETEARRAGALHAVRSHLIASRGRRLPIASRMAAGTPGRAGLTVESAIWTDAITAGKTATSEED